MPRPLFSPENLHPAAESKIEAFHADVVKEVADAVKSDPIVVVGMKQNPFPKKARRLLDKAGHDYTYLEYGSYLSMWKPRLALKMWSGWPTFPMIFVNGAFVGGASDLAKLHESGELQALLEDS